jgi:GT2 family glycosyltransferase
MKNNITYAGALNNMEQSGSSPNVGIVVLNWNNYYDTKSCLGSIESSKYGNFDVFVVDNNSTDDSIKKLRKDNKSYCYVQNDKNIGFSGGMNMGIEKALGNNVDYLLILNNDVELKSDTISELVTAAENNRNAAIVGGLMRYSDSGEIYSAGGSFYPLLAKFSPDTSPEPDVYSTEFVTGAMMLISAEYIKKYGKLNEKYFFGMEDQELCWRANRNGWNVLVNPKAEAFHKKGSSAGEGNKFRYYHSTRNRLVFAQANLKLYKRVIFYLFFIFSRIFRTVQWTLSRDFGIIYATVLGIKDYIYNHRPRRLDLLDD